MPNILFQMLLRGSNGVGYTAYPDNLIESFVVKAWENGMDVFRIFDSLNWIKAMAPSIEYVRTKTEGIAQAAISYTGDILDVNRIKYPLSYYVQLAKDLENAGAHMIAIKDMAGLLKPYAAAELVGALKDSVNVPIHLHTHDTSLLQSATYLKAIEAGVDVVDVALGGLSGLTSQPNFNSIVEMLRFHERENTIDVKKLNQYSNYWEDVRELYYPFESGLKEGTAEVFHHEIPGGQYSNLRPQANALGLGDRFEERPNAHMKPIDFTNEFQVFCARFQPGFARSIEFEDFLSYQLYPKVFEDAYEMFRKYDSLAVIPTKTFFYGMEVHEETIIAIAPGKSIFVQNSGRRRG